MEPVEDRIFVQHGVDVTFVTFNDEEILDEQQRQRQQSELRNSNRSWRGTRT